MALIHRLLSGLSGTSPTVPPPGRFPQAGSPRQVPQAGPMGRSHMGLVDSGFRFWISHGLVNPSMAPWKNTKVKKKK